MSRTRVALLVIFGFLLIWFYVAGQHVQDIEVALTLGFILGVLFGWWSGGWRVLRKIRRDAHEKVESDYDKNKERYL